MVTWSNAWWTFYKLTSRKCPTAKYHFLLLRELWGLRQKNHVTSVYIYNDGIPMQLIKKHLEVAVQNDYKKFAEENEQQWREKLWVRSDQYLEGSQHYICMLSFKAHLMMMNCLRNWIWIGLIMVFTKSQKETCLKTKLECLVEVFVEYLKKRPNKYKFLCQAWNKPQRVNSVPISSIVIFLSSFTHLIVCAIKLWVSN